jgi:aspartyl-tRNA(Asn)/glutamyl-tRNA(Gln) amidotransferase subunit A
MRELHTLSVKTLTSLLQTKEVSAVEVATRFLARMGGSITHNWALPGHRRAK